MSSLFLVISPEAISRFKVSDRPLLILSTDEIISADVNEKFILLKGDASLMHDSNLGTSSVDILDWLKYPKLKFFGWGFYLQEIGCYFSNKAVLISQPSRTLSKLTFGLNLFVARPAPLSQPSD